MSLYFTLVYSVLLCSARFCLAQLGSIRLNSVLLCLCSILLYFISLRFALFFFYFALSRSVSSHRFLLGSTRLCLYLLCPVSYVLLRARCPSPSFFLLRFVSPHLPRFVSLRKKIPILNSLATSILPKIEMQRRKI